MKTAAANISAGMTIKVAAIRPTIFESHKALGITHMASCGSVKASSPTLTVTYVAAVSNYRNGSTGMNEIKFGTVEGPVVSISTRQKVEVVA